jgi:hypothetical protein
MIEHENLSETSMGAGTLDVSATFDAIAGELDPAYVVGGHVPEEQTVRPFGLFTEGDVAIDGRRAALATATGYTGNNGEESC